MRAVRASIFAAMVLGLVVSGLPATATASHHTWKVKPGQSIQATVDLASPGDTINVFPGDYVESPSAEVALHVTKPLNLVAKSGEQPWRKVRILAAPGQHHGILVEPAT